MTDFEFLQTDFEFVGSQTVVGAVTRPLKAKGLTAHAFSRLLKRPTAILSILFIACCIMLSLLWPIFSSHGVYAQNPQHVNLPPRISALSAIELFSGQRTLENRQYALLSDTDRYPEGSVIEVLNTYEVQGVLMCDVRVDAYALAGVQEGINYPFGTDYLGRDLASRLWHGARISLFIALCAVTFNIVLGVLLGAISGYFGGTVDMILMRFSEIVGAFPQTIVATLLMLILGTGIWAVIVALAARGWVSTMRLMRAQMLRLKGKEYVLAARTLGSSDKRLILRHILPNSVGPIITRATLEVPGAIFSEAFLAFIGLGIKAPEPSIGVLLSDGQAMLTVYPYQVLFPAMLICLLMLCFNTLGNALRESFDPKRD